MSATKISLVTGATHFVLFVALSLVGFAIGELYGASIDQYVSAQAMTTVSTILGFPLFLFVGAWQGVVPIVASPAITFLSAAFFNSLLWVHATWQLVSRFR